jgi:DtxR family Mn-dependent transcriptional regulator
MVKKLTEMHLVDNKPYHGTVLTRTGHKQAMEIIRHHRLVELYLAEALGVPWDQVHFEADKLEHVLSDRLENRIDEWLGHPTHDPHGAPIPTPDGTIAQPACARLADLTPGQSAAIAEVSDRDPALLRYLGELGLYPQVKVRIVDVAPFNGPLTIRVGEAEHVLACKVAAHVLVTDIRIETKVCDATQGEGAHGLPETKKSF